jgi:hypothetical protein
MERTTNRRIAVGHRLCLRLASADQTDRELARLGFTHTVVGKASVNHPQRVAAFSTCDVWSRQFAGF